MNRCAKNSGRLRECQNTPGTAEVKLTVRILLKFLFIAELQDNK